jgi:hypothetical protein
LGANAGKTCGTRKKRSGEFSTALDFPGWKTQYVKAVKGCYAHTHEDVPYFGFGNCPAKHVKPADLESLKSDEEVVDFYLSVLRTECIGVIRGQILKLIELGLIQKKEDKTYHLNMEYKKLRNPKFNFHEMTLGGTGAIFALFSQHYQHLIKNPIEKPETPDGKKLTRSVNTAIDLVLQMLEKSRDYGRLHMIALTRHSIMAARMGFSKLAQDQQNIENQCTDCQEDLDLINNDKLAMMSLLQFLKYGLHDVDTKGTNPHEAYIEFYKKNVKLNEFKVQQFS